MKNSINHSNSIKSNATLLNSILSKLKDITLLFDINTREIVFINNSALINLENEKSKISSAFLRSIIHPDDLYEFMDDIKNCYLSKKNFHKKNKIGSVRLMNSTQEYDHFQYEIQTLEKGLLGNDREIALVTLNNISIYKNNLDVMLHEIHHRVKNNLQIISSMMDLELSRNKDEKLEKLLIKSKSRIRTISLIHEQLYMYDHLDKIEFSDYLVNLCSFIETIYRNHRKNIELVHDLDKVFLNIYISVPLALIVNELVSNAYKHAFKSDEGKIKISLKNSANIIWLIVEDNGCGIPPKSSKSKKPPTLGYKLINGLVNQIDGDIDISNVSGCKIEIKFKTKNIELTNTT